MALSYQYAGQYNTFVPTVDSAATGGLQIEFSRAPDKFHVNKYTQLHQVEIESGKYWYFDENAMARLYTTDGSQFSWADGADRPNPNLWQGFDLPAYNCQRMNFGFLVGDLAKYHASKAGGVDLVAVNSRTVAGAAMVQRTIKAVARLTDTTVMPTSNINTGAELNGGFDVTAGQYLDVGTTALPYLRKTVNGVIQSIVQKTNGMVQAGDINIIMNPQTAAQIGASPEIQNTVIQSPFAYAYLAQDEMFGLYGLPSRLFGTSKIIVDDTSYVTNKPGANAATRSWVVPYGTVIFASRPGGIEGASQSWSTVMGFFLEEMSVEVYDDPQNRRTQGNVVDNYDYRIVAPISGALLTKAVSGS